MDGNNELSQRQGIHKSRFEIGYIIFCFHAELEFIVQFIKLAVKHLFEWGIYKLGFKIAVNVRNIIWLLDQLSGLSQRPGFWTVISEHYLQFPATIPTSTLSYSPREKSDMQRTSCTATIYICNLDIHRLLIFTNNAQLYMHSYKYDRNSNLYTPVYAYVHEP